MSARMVFQQAGFGLTQFSNKDIAIAGGVRTGKQGTEGTARLKYAVYDRRLIARGVPAQEAEVGSVEINVLPETGDIEGLVDITLKRAFRGLGIGRRVVEAIAATSPDGLRIYDIKPGARAFWQKIGCVVGPKQPGRQQDGAMPAPEPAPEADAPVGPSR